MVSELESDLQDTMDWGKKWLVDFSTGKTQLVLFDWSKNTSAIDVKMYGSVVEKKSSFKMLGLTFFSKLDWGSYIISIAKSASRKAGALIHSLEFCLLRLLCISINLPYKSTICISINLPCMEYCCHVWAGALNCYLELLN